MKCVIDSDDNIEGYVLIGCRKGKYFHMYGDDEENILFTNEDFKGNLKSMDCDFIAFANYEDAAKDAEELIKCCYNEDKALKIFIAKCYMNDGFKPTRFLQYDCFYANCINIVSLNETIQKK